MFNLDNLSLKMKNYESRSISAENPTGEKGKGGKADFDDAMMAKEKHPSRDLGKGWKIRPAITLKANSETEIAYIKGPGIITHIWMTAPPIVYRNCIIKIFWDGEEHPSVRVPFGDFFCSGWGIGAKVNSEAINVNPIGGCNSYFPMPFNKTARIVIQNDFDDDIENCFYYQIDYVKSPKPEKDILYFHAYWKRENPVDYKKEYVIVEGIKGEGKFAGMYLAWGQSSNYWWGEGEVKFFLDGDSKYPTYCFTGTEDYFGGAWGFSADISMQSYETYSANYLGYHQHIKPDGHNNACTRHGMYRWHIKDPVFFEEDFKATVQALGWNLSEGKNHTKKFRPLRDDIASVAYWYQTEPHTPFEEISGRDEREVV